MRRDGGPELVIRGEHPVIPVPMLPRPGHEVSEPVEELKWGKIDDAAGVRPRGLPPSPRANPVGCLVSWEHIADAGDAAVFAADHGEPLQREGRPGTVSQQVLETLKIARHVAVDERDPDAGVNRKPTVLSSEHVGGRIGVDEPLHAEPTHDTPAHPLGEGGQISLGDRPGQQERRRGVTPCFVGSRPEDAVGRARMEMHMVIERRSKAVQEGHGTESWASLARPVTVTGRARRSTKQSLDLFDEDSREGRDRVWAVSEEAAQSLRHGDHPLPHGHRGNDAVDEMRSCLLHSAAIARRADTPALARGTLGYKVANDYRMSRMMRGLYTNPKLVGRLLRSLVCHPFIAATMIESYYIEQSWDWQFRGDDPPMKLLRHTWRRT